MIDVGSGRYPQLCADDEAMSTRQRANERLQSGSDAGGREERRKRGGCDGRDEVT